MKKKLVALLLALVMLLSVATTAAFGEEYPSYLNLESQIPVVKEGEEVPTLKISVLRQTGGGDWNDLWVAHYIEEYLGVKLDVEMLDSTEALAEKKTLMFAGNDLPDMLINCGLSTSEIVTYGQMNGQLLAMEGYINETLTPNMVKWFEENPQAKAVATAPDGHMYTLPKMLAIDNEGDLLRLFVNTGILEEMGIEAPTTLDDFLSMLYAMKEAKPDSVPLNGSIDEQNPGYFILNGLGFVSSKGFVTDASASYGYAPATKDGEFALPVATPEFKEYLTIMNELYAKGILADNFFTAEKTQVDANVTSGNTYVIGAGQTPYTYGIDNWNEWEAISPLTSKGHDTPAVNQPTSAGIGGFAISAQTQYPELCMRFADVFFSHDYTARMMWIGPKEGSEEALGYAGNIATSGVGEGWAFPETSYPEGITDLWSWLVGKVSFYANFGSNDNWKTIVDYATTYLGGEELPYKNFDLTSGDGFYRASVWEKVYPYITEYTFPNIYYIDEDTTFALTDLQTVIEPYVKQQVAMFINGTRSLDEFDAFEEELKTMGVDQLIEIYAGIWNSYKAAL